MIGLLSASQKKTADARNITREEDSHTLLQATTRLSRTLQAAS